MHNNQRVNSDDSQWAYTTKPRRALQLNCNVQQANSKQ